MEQIEQHIFKLKRESVPTSVPKSKTRVFLHNIILLHDILRGRGIFNSSIPKYSEILANFPFLSLCWKDLRNWGQIWGQKVRRRRNGTGEMSIPICETPYSSRQTWQQFVTVGIFKAKALILRH